MGADEIYRCLVENQDFVVYQIDAQGVVVYVSPSIEIYSGYKPEEFIGRSFVGFIHPEDIAEVMERFRDAAAGTPGFSEFRALHKNGSTIWVHASSRQPEGVYAGGVIGIMTDMTERKLAEEALHESEDRYRDLVENSQDLICLHDLTGMLLWLNPAPARILGYTLKEMVGRSLRDFIDPLYYSQLDEYLIRIQRDKVANPYFAVLTRDGEQRVWECHNTLRTEGVVEPIVRGMARDVTEKVRAERQLKKSEERFRVALKAAPLAVFNQDRNLRYTWIYNPRLVWPHQEHIGKTDAEILGIDAAAPLDFVKQEVLRTGESSRREFFVIHLNKKHYFDVAVEPLHDSSGNITGITGGVMDITELKEKSEQLRSLSKKLAQEKVYLENEIEAEHHFGEIVGESAALRRTLNEVKVVATTDSTVLILGETGTGKELVARAIHRMSGRNKNSFIKLNCSAIPTGLLESELFGHEKGAFTGAVSQKVGRLELADKGTLFLDEVGDIPLELQPKLLRVLQDQEFERLGATRTLKVDVRLVAATNRDLNKRVSEKQFRSDLFYRLNVFPVRLPPLRDRSEDIPGLVRHFVKKYATRMNKNIESIPRDTMNELTGNNWPGNVRELENFIERSVILTVGAVLQVPLAELQQEGAVSLGNLEVAERAYILRILTECDGVIAGPNGAAVKLGLKRTTLQSKMQRLGISRDEYNGKAERTGS